MSDRPGKKFVVLVVEDEPTIRELVCSMLGDGEVTVECAATGVEGLTRAKSASFDLILMDVVLPQMDGVTVCRLLKNDPATAHVPLYMLTAKTRPADVELACRAGADGYIHKPFKGSELMDVVARLRNG